MAIIVLLNNDNVVVNTIETDNEHTFVIPGDLTIGQSGGKIGDTWNGSQYVSPAPIIETYPDKTLDEVKTLFITRVWNRYLKVCEEGKVSVTIGAGTFDFGTDKVSQDNIANVILGVLCGVVPNPRNWTPKGQISPISVTNNEFKLIGATMMAQVDANVQNYLTHRNAILAKLNKLDVVTYDFSTGWL